VGEPCFEAALRREPESDIPAHNLFAGLEGNSKPRGAGYQRPQTPELLGKDGPSRNLRIGVEPRLHSFALHQAQFLRLEDGLAAVVDVQLSENLFYVTIDGRNGD
jgi:hypothetical protein